MEQALAAREEYVALDRFVGFLPSDAWERRTAFFDWSVADEIMHLHLVDVFGLQSITDESGFAKTVGEVRAKAGQRNRAERSNAGAIRTLESGCVIGCLAVDLFCSLRSIEHG